MVTPRGMLSRTSTRVTRRSSEALPATSASSAAAAALPLPGPLPGRQKARRQKREKIGAEKSPQSPPASPSLAEPAQQQDLRQQSKELESLFDSLKQAEDLPTMYASLKLIKDRLVGIDKEYTLTEDEQELVTQASLAVPFLMYKKTVDLLMRPRSMGGLAFSHAKADNVVQGIFEEAGVSSCSAKTTERKLLKWCPSIKPSDARKILSKLMEVGEESRSRVAEIAASVKASPGEDEDE